MAESRRFALTPQLDIKQIIGEAQQRWLRPAEICEILRNYRQFRISPEPPNKPPSGSLFLFDRKVLRYFRKDGHNWRKKKDGKTVKEAHERLKAGSVDVLHCYYAHGEGNENFQRRSYWMLEEDFMHIVFVHYLEVKSSKASYIRNREAEVNAQVSPADSPATSSSFTNQSHLPSQITDAGSPISTQTSEYEDAESADNYQTSSRYNSVFEMQQYGDGPLTDIGLFNPYATIPSPNDQYDNQTQQTAKPESDLYSVAQEDVTRVYDQTGLGVTLTGPTTQFGLTSWQEVLEHCSTEFQSAPFDPIIASTRDATFDYPKQDSSALLEYFRNDLSFDQDNIANAQGKSFWQLENMQAGSSLATNLDEENSISVEGNHAYASLLKQLSLDHLNKGEGLKKHDSFSRWMSTELGEVDDSHLKPTSEVDWSTIEGEGVTEMSSQDQETYLVGPSISQEQRFSIIDFSPNWVYTTLTTKVIINGTFLKNKEDVKKYRWSCMFGEVEVPADIIAEGTLSCHAPPHKSGRVPFYITCSDRLACSEVREFEYRQHDAQYMETIDSYNTRVKQMDLHIRLEKLLSLSSVEDPKSASIITVDGQNLMREINLLIMEVDDEWFNISKPMHEQAFSSYNTQDYLLQRLLKDKLHAWLLNKVVEDGKGPNVLDEEGQGVLHLAAALGYDWAIKPTIVSGVSVNFRDARGWTALHWAAFCGRERTVATLIGLDASPGLLTDPTFDCPTGRTPADLASASGHKGIAGFLAESSLTSHLRTLTLKDSEGRSCLANVSDMIGVEDVAERTAIQSFDGDDIQGGLSLKDSLSAVRNAAQAAARIHQVFRVESFHRKKLTEYGDDKCGISDERALSLVSLKAAKGGQHDLPVHAAAVRIQNKFRGWKGRKEFLVIRQRIVKIQAHVRGHQVRKHYKKIVWTVGIVEKAILRWRRRRSGLRGFKSEGLIEGPSVLDQPPKEDDYDFLKEGRKQTEVRLEKALARVKSMVQYPEARDQYRRLLNVVKELQEPKDGAMNDVEDVGDGDCDFMTGLEELGDDDSFMPALWQG